jgi:2-keto-4-pentenoate hydratase
VDFLQPRVEPEIGFVLRRDLAGPGVTLADALAAVEFAVPALEIIDSRIRDWRITIVDTIADNASSAGVVLGARGVPVDRLELGLMGCVLRRNGRIVETGAGAAVLGNPVLPLVWLANVLGGRGSGLAAGHFVLPGSLTASVPAMANDHFTADFAGLGTVSAIFSPEGAR